MACLKSKRKRYRPRKGLVQAAAALDVTYGHLRRVITGERPSGNLMARYQTFVASQPATPANQGIK